MIYRLLEACDHYLSYLIEHTEKVCVTFSQDICCDVCDKWHVMCFRLFILTSIHSIQKCKRNWNSEAIWYKRLKIVKASQTVQTGQER